jgi:hypothetical protein
MGHSLVGAAHTPPVQTRPAEHGAPHAPQLAALMEVSLQILPQRVVPARQVHEADVHT